MSADNSESLSNSDDSLPDNNVEWGKELEKQREKGNKGGGKKTGKKKEKKVIQQ